jgi:putative ABC transport system substrate-binding protein
VISRRTFLGAIAGSLLAAPAVGEAQQAGRVRLVGFLFQGEPSTPSALSLKDAFSRGLRAEGYVEGQNITIEDRYSDLDGLLDAVNDLVRLNVAVIMAAGTPAALAAKRVTKTIPIVAGNMADPLADGLVASLARPGGNITGNTFLAPELGPKRLQLLREVLPRVTRVAVLRHPDVYSERTMRDMLKEIEAEAKTGRLQLQVLNARGPYDFDKAFSAMVNARAGALLIFPSPMFYANYRRVVDLAARHRLPTMYVFREAVEAGGLMCYGANVPDLTRRAGKYVAKILKGAKPADLPIEQPTKFELVINLKTAKALGLTIPPALLQRADQVIE